MTMAAITLSTNEVYSALSNMILSIQTYSDNIGHMYDKLLKEAKQEAGLYGDRVVKVAVDALTSTAWAADSEAANLLALNRAPAPNVQELLINTFRKVFVTTDDYMTKRAFGDAYAFDQFNSVVLGWLVDTRRIYETTTYDAFVGTVKSAGSAGSFQNPTALTLPTPATTDTQLEREAIDRRTAELISQAVANALFDLQDVRKDTNDLGFYRAYNADDLRVVWNADWYNKIKKTGLPTIYNSEGLVDKFEEYVLPARYFGTVNTSSKTADSSTYSLVEQMISTSHYFAGEKVTASQSCPAGTSYQIDPKVICKIIHKDSIPFLTSFTANTEFFNPRSLTKNNYLIFGHNTLQALKQYPVVTIKSA